MDISLQVSYYQSLTRIAYATCSLRVVVSNAIGMPAEIFIFQRGAAPAPSAGETTTDRFVHIADPVDLAEIPAGAPNLIAEMPYYRLAEVTLTFRSLAELLDTKTLIGADIATLVQTMNRVMSVESFTLTNTVEYTGTGATDTTDNGTSS